MEAPPVRFTKVKRPPLLSHSSRLLNLTMQTPDPNSDFPNYNDPLPPPSSPYGSQPQPEIYAAQPRYAPGGYQRPPRPAFSLDVIGEAWRLLTPNLGIWIAAMLVNYFITNLPSGIFYMFNMRSVFSQLMTNPAGAPVSQPEFGVTYYVSSLFASLCAFVLSSYMFGGMMRMAIKNVRTGQADFGLLFSATDVLPSLLGAYFLIGLAVGLGSLLCVVPGLMLGAVFICAVPLIVDRKTGAIEAIKQSYQATQAFMWAGVLYVLVLGLIAYSGFLACCVGILVTFPLAIMAVAVTYRDFFPDTEAPFQQPTYPVAPLADPNG